MTRITAYCRINDDACYVNGQLLWQRDAASSDTWFKQLYKGLELSYPKFHKMDSIAQAGYLASELIHRAAPTLKEQYADDEIGMVFANRSSSADTDVRFQKSYQESTPSPALFVYTLPNIVLGEIAILNKWYGEHIFAVLPTFAPDFFIEQTDMLIQTGSKAVLCGWVDTCPDGTDVLLFLAEDAEGQELTTDNLRALRRET